MAVIRGETRFFCKSCKKSYQPTEVLVRYNRDLSQKKFLCPMCKDRLIRMCQVCDKGKMIAPENPTTGDYDTNGFLECFCTSCGCGFIKEDVKAQIKFYISKRDVKTLLDRVFTRNKLPYNEKKEVEVEIFSICKTKSQIVDIISKKFGENKDNLDKELSGKYISF